MWKVLQVKRMEPLSKVVKPEAMTLSIFESRGKKIFS